MKKILILIISLIVCCISCKTIQYVPIKGDTQIEYRDTTIYRDSIVYTPIETVKEVVPYIEPLHMETSLAEADAWVDADNRLLRGSMSNKKGITETIKYKEKIVYRDSVSYQEVPVEVIKEVVKTKAPFYQPILWLFALLSIGYIGWKILKKYLLKVV